MLGSLLDDGAGDGALLVVAHPDDETMFFSPTILSLASELRLHVLCLSTGDYDGLGALRATELPRACAQLGVHAARVDVVDDDNLRDGPSTIWPSAVVSAHVRKALELHGLRRVITFDAGGVSGHANHVGVCHGVRLLAAEEAARSSSSSSAATLVVYELLSTGWLRRHLSFWEVAITIAAMALGQLTACQGRPRRVCFVSPRPWACHLAMREHTSQYVWYRRLYVLLSRYVFVNTLVAHRSGSPPRLNTMPTWN